MHSIVLSLTQSIFWLTPPQRRMCGFKFHDGNKFMNSGRFYKEATRLTKLHGAQLSLVQILANWQWHVSLTSYPGWDRQGLEQDAFPCQLSCSGGMAPHPPTNARGWLAIQRWYYSGKQQKCWAETERWWKAHSCGTIKAMLLVGIRHLNPQSAREGQFCKGVGHGHCSGVTWTCSSPQNCFCPTDSAHQSLLPALLSVPSLVCLNLLTSGESSRH